MFSNATEAMIFIEKNCNKCNKNKRCSAKRDIDLAFCTGELSKKTIEMIDFRSLKCNNFDNTEMPTNMREQFYELHKNKK